MHIHNNTPHYLAIDKSVKGNIANLMELNMQEFNLNLGIRIHFLRTFHPSLINCGFIKIENVLLKSRLS